MTHLMPEDVPEEDFTTVTDVNSIYDLYNEDKITLAELDRLKNEYYGWYYSEKRYATVLRFYRQPDGTMTMYEQVYVQTYGERTGSAERGEELKGSSNPSNSEPPIVYDPLVEYGSVRIDPETFTPVEIRISPYLSPEQEQRVIAHEKLEWQDTVEAKARGMTFQEYVEQ